MSKEVKKMKVDPSRTKLDATENDKRKLATLQARLSLLRKLLNTSVNTENEGFALNPRRMHLELFQLDNNKAIEENREVIWNSIGKCSEHLSVWESLFNE